MNYDIAYLEKYVYRELSENECHVLEKEMEKDSVLADLVLGLQMTMLRGERLQFDGQDVRASKKLRPIELSEGEKLLTQNEKNTSIKLNNNTASSSKFSNTKKTILRAFSWIAAALFVLLVWSNWPRQEQNSALVMAEKGFVHYPDQISVRGETLNLFAAMRNYNSRKYKHAINELLPICLEQNEETACFYAGMSYCLVESPELEKCVQNLNKVGPQSSFYDMSKYYSALALIRLGQIGEAKLLLKKIVEEKKYKYRDADKLLESLE